MTTASQLLAAIDAADRDVCVDLLIGLPESARRALYPAIARRMTELDVACSDFRNSHRARAFAMRAVADLASLGLANFGDLKRGRVRLFSAEGEAAAIAILSNRRPVWLAAWAEFELEHNFSQWTLVRSLVLGGFIPRPSSPFYILGMISAPRRGSAREFLERDPALREYELWQLFEHEGSGELSLAAYDKYVPPANRWAEAFCSMATDGKIDRARVLQATCDALQRDISPFRAGWFSRLHEALKPREAERAALCERYLDLLNSRVPATVSFTMKALMEAHKCGALNVLDVADRLVPALEARDKGTPERGLALLRKATRGCAAPTRARVAALAARALGHPSPEVQSAALELVGDDAAIIEPYLDTLAPSLRARFKEAVPAEAGSAAATPQHEGRVAPIANFHELVETFAAVLENQGPPIEIERVIDGVVRIGIEASGSAGFDRLTAALAKRAEVLASRSDHSALRAALAMFALAWVRGLRTACPTGEANLGDFLIWRLWSASEQAAARVRQPLLSLPTSSDGRIDAQEFNCRLSEMSPAQRKVTQADRKSLFHLDFLLAQLRASGCDAPVRSKIVWKKSSWEVDRRTYVHWKPTLEIEGVGEPSRFEPAALTLARLDEPLEMKRWCATVSPRWREGWFAAGCCHLGDNLNWHGADWSTRAYLESLLTAQPIGEMGGLLMALGLSARESGECGLATDALIAASSDGRLDGVALGSALTQAAASGAIKYGRWARQLQLASQAGSEPARVIFLALEALLESKVDMAVTDFGRLLELAYELAHLTGLRLTRPGSLGTLSRFAGRGKAARAVACLLELSNGVVR